MNHARRSDGGARRSIITVPTLWRTVLVLALVAMVATGCDAGGEQASTSATNPASTSLPPVTTSSAPVTTTSTVVTAATVASLVGPYGGEAIVGLDAAPAVLNPYVPGGSGHPLSTIGQTWWAMPIRVNGYTLELEPVVLAKVPTRENRGISVNDDGTITVTFEIHPEAVWEDGIPITGSDFEFTYKTIMNPDYPISKNVYENIVATEFDDDTFAFTVKGFGPAEIISQFGALFQPVLPEHQIEGSDFVNDWNTVPWLSAGPFRFDSWVAGVIVVVRNPMYWRATSEGPLPYLDRVVFFTMSGGEEAKVAAFEAREIDAFAMGRARWRPELYGGYSWGRRTYSPEQELVDVLTGLRTSGAVVDVAAGSVWSQLSFQFGPGRLIANPDSQNEHLLFREAVAHAIDKEFLVARLFGGEVEPLESYVGLLDQDYAIRPWTLVGFDPARAKELLDEHCAAISRDCDSDPIRIVLAGAENDPVMASMAPLITGMLTTVGFEVDAKPTDSSILFGETLDNGEWDLAILGFREGAGLSGIHAIHHMFDPAGAPPEGQNYTRWGTEDSSIQGDVVERFAQLIEAFASAAELSDLLDLAGEAEKLLAEEVAFLPLFPVPQVAAVWANEIGGFKHNTSWGITWNVEEWYRLDL